MKLFRYIIPIILMSVMACGLAAQERRALAIGIGQYKDPMWGRINADSDMHYVSEVLEEFRFTDVTVLKNEEATKSAIVSEIADLTRRSGKGDIVYVHFSGHGQQVKDLDGDEDDGLDESWIPYDAYRKCCLEDDGSMHLMDDEINVLLGRLRDKVGDNGQILVVVDACHSGGSSRGAVEDEDFISRGVGDVFVPSAAPVSRSLVREDWIQISACEDYQVNFEVRKPKVGKLTYCLYKLRKYLPKLSNDDLWNELTDMMDSPEMISPMAQNPHFGEGKDRYDVRNVFRR
jgi:hypothetical protein